MLAALGALVRPRVRSLAAIGASVVRTLGRGTLAAAAASGLSNRSSPACPKELKAEERSHPVAVGSRPPTERQAADARASRYDSCCDGCCGALLRMSHL